MPAVTASPVATDGCAVAAMIGVGLKIETVGVAPIESGAAHTVARGTDFHLAAFLIADSAVFRIVLSIRALVTA